ncbi:MAG TPA: hypothetical protein DCO79_06310 [Spirochaeta sp.]|nr:hypothetical protein [Spirochaeta sp.]
MELMYSKRAAMRGRDVRKGNEKLVLRLIQKEALLSQSEVVEMTGLKAPTILRIFKNLEEAGLIQVSEIPKETSEKKGRKPVYYRLNPEALYVIGVEFWALSATVVISNFIREPVYSSSVAIGKDSDGDAVLEIIYMLIKDSLKKKKIELEQLAGIGIGAPGKVDIEKGEVIYYSRINGLHGLPVAAYLEERFEVPILVHNNCSVLAMNEYSSSHPADAENIMAVLIRGGVGGAYINGGKIMTSGNITTMEIGHMSVDPDGRQCSCGFKGCLETYLSEEAILSDVGDSKNLPDIKYMDKQISGISNDDSSKLKAVLDEKAKILAYALKNLMHLFSPDLFLIISRSIELSNYLSEKAFTFLNCVDDRSEGQNIRVKAVCYNPLHAGMGACDIVFQDFFSGDI